MHSASGVFAAFVPIFDRVLRGAVRTSSEADTAEPDVYAMSKVIPLLHLGAPQRRASKPRMSLIATSQFEIVLELINRIYDAVADSSRWPGFLEAFLGAIRGRKGSFVLRDSNHENLRSSAGPVGPTKKFEYTLIGTRR